METFKNTYKTCKEILSLIPDTRDDMMLLVRYVHISQMKSKSIAKPNYFDALFDGKLSSIKTIDRTWRKVQEDIPSLRGKKWGERQRISGAISVAIPTLFDDINRHK